MTALATGLALVPFVLFGDRAGLEIVSPMAVVILGGLVTSTLLNLFIVPALYVRFGASSERDTVREPAAQEFSPAQAPVLNFAFAGAPAAGAGRYDAHSLMAPARH